MKFMNDSFLLQEEDMLNESHLPVIIFFGVISNKNRFIRIANELSQGVGYGFEYAACTFPEDLDEFDITQGESFDGVEFSLQSGEEVVISYKDFYYYLNKACNHYLVLNPEDKKSIDAILKRAKSKFSSGE